MRNTKHIVRYGTVGDKVHLEKAVKTFDYLAINANSAAYVSGAITQFVIDNLYNNSKKGYFIDPITYAFQKNIHLLKNKDLRIKNSILKLVDCYKSPATNVLRDEPIQLSDFEKEDELEAFCENILEFQFSVFSKHVSQDEMGKYLTYNTNSSLINIAQLHPKFLIAPYFYLDVSDPDYIKWLEINIRCISISKAKVNAGSFGKLPVFAQIVLSQNSLLNENVVNEITEAYSKSNCDGFTIWIDDLKEQECNYSLLNSFSNFLRGIRGKPIYNMYGGFFSILLTHKSIDLLQGVSHGLEYGESRAVFPVGGGIPVSKYYFMPLHQRSDFTKAFYLLEHNNVLDINLPDWGPTDRYYNEVCKCNQCKQIMQASMINFIQFESDQFYEIIKKTGTTRRKKASPETKENCLYHYLLCKRVEFSTMTKKGIIDILDDLVTEKGKYEKCINLVEHELDYLDNWNKVIRSFIKE